MFERYTENARRVIYFARHEACELGATQIRTEHLLLGLVREVPGTLLRVLGSDQVASIRPEIVTLNIPGIKISLSADMPLHSDATAVLLLAAEEADRLADKQVRPEHILVGLIRGEMSLAAELLRQRGAEPVKARQLLFNDEKRS